MPTIVKRIGPGEDFETAQEWADDIGTNAGGFYTTGDIAHGHVAANLSTSAVLLFFPVANATNPVAGAILSPDPGNEANGQKGVGRRLTSSSATNPIIRVDPTVDYSITVEDLEFENTSTNATHFSCQGVYVNNQNLAIEIIIRRCLFHATPHAASTSSPQGIRDRYGRARIIRCMFENWSNTTLLDGEAIEVGGANTLSLVDGCSMDGCDIGVNSSNANCAPRNTIAMGGSTCFSGSFNASANKNMSSDATAPGTVNYRNESRAAIWVDPDNGDWTLQSGTNAIGNGDNLGSTYEQDIDIQNNAVVGDWNLGAYHGAEVPPAPGIPVSGQRRLHTFGL